MKLQRVEQPILEPILEHYWVSRAVLNPGTVRQGKHVHMLYRAVEGENFSTLGYAKLDSEGNIIERRNEPVIKRTENFESQGCEDPRIIEFDGKYYIFYSAFDGKEVRICAASTEDFLQLYKIRRYLTRYLG